MRRPVRRDFGYLDSQRFSKKIRSQIQIGWIGLNDYCFPPSKKFDNYSKFKYKKLTITKGESGSIGKIEYVHQLVVAEEE